MAVNPVGNMTFINQNAQVGSVQQANTQVKLDFQAMVNLQNLQEKEDQIQEVRPTEETLEVKNEREGNGKEEKGEEEESKESKGSEESLEASQDSITTDNNGTITHLNISV